MQLHPGRALKVALLTFIISIIISFLFQFAIVLWLALLILWLVILIGIVFDVIGTAVTAAQEAPFHAMSADKVRGARQAIYLVRHAARVANFCNDVVGDIAGTLSGAIIASIVLQFVRDHNLLQHDLFSAIGIGLTAALTVGGKALGKSYAITKANQIVFSVAKLLAVFKSNQFNFKKVKQQLAKKPRKARRA